ncbi:hypothetical protein R1sor_017446 [Riccia sorocarpa]|uniref:VQ domain-containing protein n=1 Tax=Riccia sorocarpa TaxID=122646 RepID=A0ABD3ID38_9MARC
MSKSSTSSNSRQNKRPTPLKMAKEEVRQYRPPVIIHTYSPKIIKVDPAEFSTLVQKLTGRGLKRKPECSPKPREYNPLEEGSCVSPSTSGDSGSHQGGAENGSEGCQGFASPRGPLVSFEPLYQQHRNHHHHNQYDQSTTYSSSMHQGNGANVNEQANLFANAVLAGPQYSPLFGSNPGPHLFSPLPSPSFLNPSFMQDLPVLSPGTYQAFDPYSSLLNPSPTYGRYATAASLPSPGSSLALMIMIRIEEELVMMMCIIICHLAIDRSVVVGMRP